MNNLDVQVQVDTQIQLHAYQSSTSLKNKPVVIAEACWEVGRVSACSIASDSGAVVVIGRTPKYLNESVTTTLHRECTPVAEVFALSDTNAQVASIPNSNQHLRPSIICISNSGFDFPKLSAEGPWTEICDALAAIDFHSIYHACIGVLKHPGSGGKLIKMSLRTAKTPGEEKATHWAPRADVEPLTRTLFTAYERRPIYMNSAVTPTYLYPSLKPERKITSKNVPATIGPTPVGCWRLRTIFAKIVSHLTSKIALLISRQVGSVDELFPRLAKFGAPNLTTISERI